MKHWIISSLALLGVCSSCSQVNKLSPEEYDAAVKNDSSAVILDVRTAAEYEAGHLKNAILMDFNDSEKFNESMSTLDKSKTYYLYCRSGRRSNDAAVMMQNNGFKVFDMKGGITKWEEQGHSIVNTCFATDAPTATGGGHPLMQNEEKIDQIIATMTLEEKVNMLHAKNYFSSAGVERLGIADIEYADCMFGIREEMEPRSWNSLHLTTDSATFFPTGSALAATWSKELAYKYGAGVGVEARLRGKDMVLGPSINIQRLPTGGRTYEYLSEDPLLSAELTVSYTLGMQNEDVAVCLKHFAVNSQENMRGFINSQLSERALREIYLLPFEAAVRRANAYGVMAAYNKVWGDWCSENDMLLNKILRDEWGFRGFVISDWGGTHSTVKAAQNGLDVEMPDSKYFGKELLEAVKAGKVSEAVIDSKVRNLLRVRMVIPAIPKEEANKEIVSKPAQQQVAYEVASKSIVMLKNNTGLLPINKRKVKSVAVIGDNAIRTMAQGGVGAGVKALYEVTPLQGLQKAFEKAGITMQYAPGYEMDRRRSRNNNNADERNARANQLMDEAVAAAKDADIVLFIGGNNRVVETEGSDRKTITLPYRQEELIQRVAEVNPNIVAVMVAAAPVDLRVVDKVSPSLLISWFNGTEGGNALADIIMGKIAPSGKLPFSYPARLEDSPAYSLGVYPQQEPAKQRDIFVGLVNKDSKRNEQKAEAIYGEDIFVGYRWFVSKDVPQPIYSFGHGISYVDFAYSDLAVATKDGALEVTFTLENNGKMDAEEVAQVYVGRNNSAIERPKYELKGFRRVDVEAGESKRVTIVVPAEALCHWDEASHAWALERGEATIYVGTSSVNLPLTAQVSLDNL